MKTIEISWKKFRDEILKHIEEKKGSRLCRGQADSTWSLITSFHRNNHRNISFENYFNLVIPYLADAISTLEKREIDVSNPQVRGAFLAYAQHHGLPTPLLDWTFSPYKAAYYAFSSVEDIAPKSDKVAIYIFDHVLWQKRYKQILDFNEKSLHVSLLFANSKGNHRQIYQQGTYLFTNTDKIEEHITLNETNDDVFLTKYIFSVREKPIVMEDLEAMGIQAFSLFGGTDGMFRFFKESIFRAESVGTTPKDEMENLLKKWIAKPAMSDVPLASQISKKKKMKRKK